MQQLPIKAKIKMFSIIMLVCFIGLIASSFMIDKKINSYIADLKSVNNINVNVINNTDNNIDIEQYGNDIQVYINPEIEDMDVAGVEVTKIDKKYVTITSEIGLNVRSKPSISSEKVGAINYGGIVLVTEEHNGWYKTDLGFIYKKFTN